LKQIAVVFPGNERGGAATHITAFAKAVAAHQLQSFIRFLSLGTGPLQEDVEKVYGAVTVLEGSTRGRMRALAQTMRETDRDTLWHAHGPRANVVVYRAARTARRQFTSTIHSDPLKDFLGSRLKSVLFTRLNLFCLRRTVGVFVGNRAFATHVPDVPAFYVPNAIEPVDVDEVRETAQAELCRSLGIEPGSVLIGVVARLDKVKDIGTAIAALPLIRTKMNRPVHLVSAGPGDELPELVRLATLNGVRESVHFLGFVKDTPGLYQAFDVHVLPSKSEGESPFAILEAGAFRTPNVGSDIPGIKNLIVDGETGLLFPQGNAVVLSERIVELLTQPGLAANLVQNFADKVLPRFSLAAMLKGYLEGYTAMGFAIPESESRVPPSNHSSVGVLSQGES
jgi:L-malate glycosyltransferase